MITHNGIMFLWRSNTVVTHLSTSHQKSLQHFVLTS